MDTYMLTIPRQHAPKKAIKWMIDHNDCKKWTVAMETGHGGLKHWQIRLQTSNSQFFEWVKKNIPQAHIEKAQDKWEYEKKEGHYWTSEDTPQILSCRYGKPRHQQKNVIKALRTQSDRQVDVVYDPEGNWGKSWLIRHLYETGKACYVPPTMNTVQGIIQWVHSAYKGEEFIVIDIPRSWKWSEQLYVTIETVKDGLVYDPRYSANMRDIWGVKVLVMTNTLPKVEKLSEDRWRIMQVS